MIRQKDTPYDALGLADLHCPKAGLLDSRQIGARRMPD